MALSHLHLLAQMHLPPVSGVIVRVSSVFQFVGNGDNYARMPSRRRTWFPKNRVARACRMCLAPQNVCQKGYRDVSTEFAVFCLVEGPSFHRCFYCVGKVCRFE